MFDDVTQSCTNDDVAVLSVAICRGYGPLLLSVSQLSRLQLTAHNNQAHLLMIY
mgnify:CR=1 FL=1